LNVVRTLHHAFGFGGAPGIIVMHQHQWLTGFNEVANFLRLLKPDGEINRVACLFTSAAERNDGVPDLIARDAVDVARLWRSDRLLMLGHRQLAGVTTLGADHLVELLQAGPTGEVFLQVIRLAGQLEHRGGKRQCNFDEVARTGFTGKDVEALLNFESVTNLLAERLIHVSLERDNFLAVPFADFDHGAAEFERSIPGPHECAGAPLHIEHEASDILGQLLRHDAGDDEWEAGDGGGHVAQCVELLVGRRDFRSLAGNRAADGVGHANEFVEREAGPKAGDAFEFVECSAGGAETATGDHRDPHAAAGNEWRENERDLVADAAGTVFISEEVTGFPFDDLAGLDHGARKPHGFVEVHALKADGHCEGGHLVFGQVTAGEAFNEESNFGFGQGLAVTLLLDDLGGKHRGHLSIRGGFEKPSVGWNYRNPSPMIAHRGGTIMMKFWAVTGLALGLGTLAGRAEITVSEPTAPPPRPAGTVTAVAPAVTSVAAGVDADVLKFRNGDLLHGSVLGATPAGGFRWRRSDVKEPIVFNLDNVGDVMLTGRVKASTGHRAIAELTNGDALAGDLTALDDKTLTLKTWYAGTLSIKRSMLQRLAFVSEVADAAYTGPNSIDEWKTDGNRNAWTFRKGALYGIGGGTIGRDVKLPDVANIEFDLAWRGQLYCNVGFGFDDVRQIYNSGGYMVQMSYTQVYLQRYRPRSGNSNMGSNVEMQELQRKTKLHVSIRINKPKKMIALFFDGNLVKQWTESDDWAAKGTGLVLLSQGQGQTRISGISVTSWDGRLDGDASASAKDADLLRLNNGDKVSGMVKSIANGQVALAASFAEMNVPLERIVAVEFASAKSERSRRNAADIQAFFPDGRRVTFALEKLDEQNLSGMSETCGRITAALGAFRRVQFHIYEKREDSGDDEWSSGGAAGAAVIMDE